MSKIQIEWTVLGSRDELEDVDDDPSSFVYSYEGVAQLKEGGKIIPIGECTVYYLDIERANEENCAISDVFDAHSESVCDYYPYIMADSEYIEFSESVETVLGYGPSYINIAILDQIALQPEFRGNGYGLTILEAMIARTCEDAGLFALKPYPLQLRYPPHGEHEIDERWSELGLSEFRQSRDEATENLQKYYARAGFQVLPDSPYMILGGE